MIELRSVVKTYPDGRGGSFSALDGISARFADGELTVVLGPSGSGKSTLLRLVNRMVEPDSGSVLLDGVDARELDPVQLRRSTGYVIQNIGLFPHLSVADNIGIVPRLLRRDRAWIRRRVDELLDLVRLPRHFASRRPHQLSGGEAQRVGVARALAPDPRVLLMDEPFGALDTLTREALQEEFARIQRILRKTILFVTHDVAEAARLADRIVVMRAGGIAGQGSPAGLARGRGGYVDEFLGSRLVVELLGRVRIAERTGAGRAAGPGAGTGAENGREPEPGGPEAFPLPDPSAAPPLDDTATLRDALARMVADRATEIPVRGADGRVRRLRFSDLAGLPVTGSGEPGEPGP